MQCRCRRSLRFDRSLARFMPPNAFPAASKLLGRVMYAMRHHDTRTAKCPVEILLFGLIEETEWTSVSDVVFHHEHESGVCWILLTVNRTLRGRGDPCSARRIGLVWPAFCPVGWFVMGTTLA